MPIELLVNVRSECAQNTNCEAKTCKIEKCVGLWDNERSGETMTLLSTAGVKNSMCEATYIIDNDINQAFAKFKEVW